MLVSDDSDDDKAQSININLVIPQKKRANNNNEKEVQNHLQQKSKMPELRFNGEKSANLA